MHFCVIETHTWSILPVASVYTAKLYSIYQALFFSEILNSSTILIITDSLSSLQALSNTFSKDPLVQRVLSRLVLLTELNKDIIFIWVPSHIGIVGNEKAVRGHVKQLMRKLIILTSFRFKAYFFKKY